MADIVPSLFGMTPESYQQAQQERADAQALQFARLSPYEKASYGISRGAYGLAGAIGGALGGQDPELQRITMRQQIAGQLNMNDPASIERGIAALSQAGDPQGAMMLQAEYRKIQESNALIGQREAAGKASLAAAGRERLQGIPNDIQLAREISILQEQINQFTALPASPQRDQALRLASGQLAELQRLTTKEIKDPRFGTDREAIAEEVYGASYAGLTQEQKAAINLRVEAEKNRKAKSGAPSFVLPGNKDLIDIPKFRNTVQGTIDPQLKAINATDQALEAIETSLATGNFASYRAAQTQFARAISGAGDLSQRELKAAGADPSLLGGTADYLSSLFTSTPTTDTQNKIKVTLEAIRKVAANKARTEVQQQLAIAIASPGYDPIAVTRALTFPELASRAAAPAPGAAGGDLAAQAAAELARRAGKAK